MKFGGQNFALYKQKKNDASTVTPIATGSSMYMTYSHGAAGTVKVLLEPDEELIMKLPGNSNADGFKCPDRNGQPCKNNPDPIPYDCGFVDASNCFNWDSGRIFLFEFTVNGVSRPINSWNAFHEAGWEFPKMDCGDDVEQVQPNTQITCTPHNAEVKWDALGFRIDGGREGNYWLYSSPEPLPTLPPTPPPIPPPTTAPPTATPPTDAPPTDDDVACQAIGCSVRLYFFLK